MKHAIEYALARAALGAAAQGTLGFSLGIARLLDRAVPRLRQVAERNLELAGLPRSIADGVYESIGRTLYTFARLPAITRDNVRQWIDYDGFAHYAEAKRRGRGVLFATAHLGNWELSAYAHALLTEPMTVVVRPLDNPRLDAWVTARRSGSGNRIAGKKDFLRGVLRTLHANGAAGILIDQNAGLQDGIFVDFFGRPACVNAGFMKLAYRSGAAVIPGFALWEPALGRYVLRFLPALEPTGDLHTDTQRLHATLEGVIRQHPDQWLWIHRRWKTRPPGEPPLY